MDCYQEKTEESSNLILVLKNILESNCQLLEQTYLERLLTSIQFLLDTGRKEYLSKLSELLVDTLKYWKKTHPTTCVLEFFSYSVGILCKNEQIFVSINEKSVVNDVIEILHQNIAVQNSLNLVFIKLLFNILSHTSGYEWIKMSQQWKYVIQLSLNNSHLQIDRESRNLTAELVKKSTEDDNLIEEILREILHPISKKENINIFDKSFHSKIVVSFRLLETVLKNSVFETNIVWEKLNQIFDIESFLKYVLESWDAESVQDGASTLFVIFSIAKCTNKHQLLSMQQIPINILEVFSILLKKRKIKNIIKLAKYCQILWSEMRNTLKCKSKTVINFIILQLIPVMVYNKNSANTKLIDMYVQKLFDLTSESTQKFVYSFGDELKKTGDSNSRDCAIKGIISVAGNMELLNQDEAVIIFQSAAYALKIFICETRCDNTLVLTENCEEKDLFCDMDSPVLSAVLNTLCVIIENFKINWNDSLGSLFLLKITCNLLRNYNLSTILAVQTLLLVKLLINNFVPSNLTLIMNTLEDSSLNCLMDVLYKRMHDPNWEVRDSCIEVIIRIAEFGKIKYPAFQQLLLEKEFCSLIFNIMEGDSSSYVRASAVRALSVMVNIQSLKHSFDLVYLTLKGMEIIQIESEAIVRREIALLMRQIYLIQDDTSDVFDSIYNVMSYTAISDLHWEVKVNSLLFWEAVIHRVISNQGMIDGVFPKATFSEEYKKIVTLTNDEIKLRLHKILNDLSKAGCLYVLISTLNDECDFQVVQKSAQLLKYLMDIIKRYDLIEKKYVQNCDRFAQKRKNTELHNEDKRKASDLFNFEEISNDNILVSNSDDKKITSDEVIEDIINQSDLNLLVNVYHPCDDKNFLGNNFKLQEIKPEIFLFKMQNIDFDAFLEEKRKCLINSEMDLKFFSSAINNIKFEETNVMDCY